MGRWTLFAACLALLLPGCADPSFAPLPQDEPARPTVAPEPAFPWNASVDGSVAFRIAVRPEAPGKCTLGFHWRSTGEKAGYDGFIAHRSGEEFAWVVMGARGELAEAHAGNAGTDGLLASRPDDGWLGADWQVDAAGPVTFTMAATSLRAGGGDNVRLDLGCEHGYALEGLEGGRHAVVFGAPGENGVGADTLLVGAEALDTAALDSATATSLLLAEPYTSAGRATLTHPNGRETFEAAPHLLDLPHLWRWDGPAGRYGVEVSSAARGGGLWGALMELHPVERPALA
jgi:hypothetical protein